MIRIFIGFDHRQPVSYQVLHHSIMRRASVPVSITPLYLPQLPITRVGLTPFTYSRYLVPWLCGYEGYAVFMDSDMLCLCDISEFYALRIDSNVGLFEKSVAVRNFGKDARFERPSLMIFNNENCDFLTPEYVNDLSRHPQSFEWATSGIGSIPEQYNRLVGYEDCSDAKILHYTAGVPAYAEVQHLGYTEPWHEEHRLSNLIAPFTTLMGNSVHIPNLGLGNERSASNA